jgi:Flp pilus assembly protein TadG
MRHGKVMNRTIIFWRAVGGNAGAEFALLLPLLAVLLFGGIEIGRLLHDYHVVREGVRDAGRYLSRVEADCSSVDILDDDEEPFYTAAQHKSRARNLALRGDVNSSAPLLLGYWNDPNSVDIAIDCSIDNSANPKPYQGILDDDDSVPLVVVTATVPFTFLFGQLVTSSGTIDLILSHKVVSVGF